MLVSEPAAICPFGHVPLDILTFSVESAFFQQDNYITYTSLFHLLMPSKH